MTTDSISRCAKCAAYPDSRSFGVSDRAGVGIQTAIVECECGERIERSSADEGSVMTAAIAAWNAANQG